MVSVEHLFWDSCVFTAFLGNQEAAYDIASIEKYLTEAKAGKVMIHASTISSAEVLPSQIAAGGSFEDFLQDFQGAVHTIDPNPNVMARSGRLRDLTYKKGPGVRKLGTADAIILATALYLEDAEGVKLSAFHTFDKGRKPDETGKAPVPLLGFEEWCEGFSPEQMAVVAPVIALNRTAPLHPEPDLDFNAKG